jgi:hypothetical protein
MRRVLASLLACTLGLSAPARAQVQPSPEQEAADGIRQVREGDFERAVTTLDSAVRRLEGQPGRERLLVQALVQIGVALVALDQNEPARARFRRALTVDGKLRLRTDGFSPKVIAVFEQARAELDAKGPDVKGSGSKVPLVLVGVGAAAAGVIVAARGGDDGPEGATASLTNGRFNPPNIVCPDDTRAREIFFIVLADLTATTETVFIDQAVVEMTVTASPAIPSELGFLSNRSATPTPARVEAGTTATVRVDSTLLCDNAPGNPARYNEWSARVTLRTAQGSLTVTTNPPALRVDIP